MKSRTVKLTSGSSLGRSLSEARLAKLLVAGKAKEALSLALEIRQLSPQSISALRVCVQAAIQTDEYQKALTLYREWIGMRPNDIEPCMGYAQTLSEAGLVDEAHEQFNHALQLAPDNPDVCGYLSSMHFNRGEFSKSLNFAERSIAGNAENWSAHNARGAALLKLERYEEALLALAKAIELYPGEYYADAAENLGLTLHDMRCFEQAHACYEQMYEIDPQSGDKLALLLHSALQICHWSRLDERIGQLLTMIRQGRVPGTAPFMFLSMPYFTGGDHLLLAAKGVETMLATQPSTHAYPSPRPVRSGRHRIGYLSADFHDHATTHLLVEVLELHDRDRFELFAYSYGPDDGSTMRHRVVTCFDQFRDLQNANYHDAAETIRFDDLDLLVDLKGWTHGARLEISAMHPAPAIVSWLGYPGTLGHAGLADYILGDPVVTPLAHATHFAETIIQLPDTYQPNDRKRQIGSKPKRDEVGLPEGAVVFCNFNQSYKITPEMFSAWCEVLRRVDGSVLWLLEPSPVAAKNLRDESIKRGIDPARLVLAPRMPLPTHLGRLGLASLALDTFPYTSHTTCSDALWTGVPLLTLIGETFASRVAASLLTAVGMPELVMTSFDEYVEHAVALGSHPDQLQFLRLRLDRQKASCALFDAPRFTRNLERAYERVVIDVANGVRQPIIIKEEVENE